MSSMLFRRYFFLTILLAIFGIVLVGCKEGTENSPVSKLLTGSDVTTQTVNLTQVAEGPAEYSIEGTVVSKTSLEKLSNINVALYYSGSLAMQTRTTSEGKFFFFKIPPGLYDLVAGNGDTTYASTTYVVRVLDSGKMSPEAPEIQLDKLAQPTSGPVLVKISGQVYSADSRSPVDNMPVELWSNDAILKSTVTSGEGKFFFESIASGLYRIEVAKDSQFYQQKSVTVNVLSDGTISPPSPEIYLTANTFESFTISGFVKTQSNEILSNLRVDIRKDSSTAPILSTTYTSGEGKFFFQNLTSGMYYIKAAAGTTTTESSLYPVRILSTGEMSPAQAEILVSTSQTVVSKDIKGNIYEAFTGSPLEYAVCKIEGISNGITDKNGDFSFTELLPNIYKMEISKNGFETLSISFKLNADGTTQPSKLYYPLVHSLRSGYGSIVGRLVDEATETGRPNLIARLYVWEKTKKSNGGTEFEEYEITGLTQTTKTLDADSTDKLDQKGTFKFTHLGPTGATKKYALIITQTLTQPLFKQIDYGHTGLSWTVPDLSDPNNLFTLTGFEVEAEKTTFYTNYEHEK